MNYYSENAIIGLLVIFITIRQTHSVPCTYRQTVGTENIDAANVNSPDPQDANITILMANPMGTIQCCGSVIAWEMYMEGEGSVSVQIWRPVTGQTNKYILLGQHVVKHKSTGISKEGKSLSQKNAIQILPGDLIGFIQEGTSTLRYTTCDPALPSDPDACADDPLVHTGDRDTSVGDVVEFVLKQSAHLGVSKVRGYALKAYLNKKSQASCTDRHRTISDTMDIGEHVINVHVDNLDIYDLDSYISFTAINQPIPFSIHPKTGEITVSGVLSPEYPSTKYELTVQVNDSCFDISSTCSVTITVNNDPKPVTFISLPSSVEISTFDTGHIYDFSITTQREVDDVYCYIKSIFPDHASFDVKNESKTEYSVYLTQAPPLSDMLQKSTFVIVLVIACENTEGQYNQSTLTLTYDSDKKRLGTLMVVTGIIITLVLLAIVTVLVTWLCYKGKIKTWPSNNKKTENEPNISNNKTLNHTDRGDHTNTYSQPRDTNQWDNFNSFYKIDRTPPIRESPVYEGLQNGGLAHQMSRANRSILISHSQQHSFGNDIADFYNSEEIPYHKQVFRKKPWKP